jgi:ribosomal protein L30/L7E
LGKSVNCRCVLRSAHVDDTPENRGMMNKVHYLIEVKEA